MVADSCLQVEQWYLFVPVLIVCILGSCYYGFALTHYE